MRTASIKWSQIKQCYSATLLTDDYKIEAAFFPTVQAAADYFEANLPGKIISWDIRPRLAPSSAETTNTQK